MATIHIQPHSVATTPLRMFYGDTELSLGTGFFYEIGGKHYLVTNWHNVAGRSPEDQKVISPTGGLPESYGRKLVTV